MAREYGIGVDMDDGSGDGCSVGIYCTVCQNFITSICKEREEDLFIPVIRKCPKCGVRFDGFRGVMEYNA